VAPQAPEQFTASGGTGTGYVWSLATNASNGTIDPSSGAYVAGPRGSVSDVVQLTDSASSFALATVTVTPSITISPSSEVLEPGSMQTFRASGGSGAGYVWSFMTNASQGTVDASTGAYTAGPVGNVTDFIQCTDSLANYATAMVTVTKALSISPASLTVESGGIHTFTASGGSGSGYVWSFATNASGGTLNSLTGAYVAGPVSEVTDIIQLTDSLGRSTTANVMVTVVLTISPASVALMTGGSQAFTASGGSGSGYVWSLATNESNGTINASSGAYVAGTTAGSDVVQVTDSSGDVAQAGVNVKSASSSCLSVTGGDALPLLLLALLPLVRGRRRGTRGRARHGVESGRG
jgi:predicted secreted protein